MLDFCLILAKGQNAFFYELAEAIADEIRSAGCGAEISVDGFPPAREDLIYIVLPPHEYYRLEGVHLEPRPDILKRTIFVCAEQPGTSFFDEDVYLAPRAGAVFDINVGSIAEFARRGVPGVRHLRLGWTPTWSPVSFEPGQADEGRERSIDLLHMGIYSPNRGVALAAAAKHLQRYNTQLILADDRRANSAPQANFIINDDKWRLLSDTRVLLNVHVAERPYFEWLRVVQAISAGCAVISEHSSGYAPLQPYAQLLFGETRNLGLLAAHLLEDEDRRWGMARDAWLFLRSELPFARSVAGLVEAGHELAANPVPADGRVVSFAARKVVPALEDGGERLVRYPSLIDNEDSSRIRAGIKDLRLDLMNLGREQRRRELREHAGGVEPPTVERVMETRAYRGARPRVSVITALYNYERHIAAALESAAGSRDVDLELIVVDDGSSDGSRAAAAAWMRSREDIPALLVRHPVNRGLGAARNTALDFARGELVFVLDADNEVYADGVGRLVHTLDQAPDAVFAWGLLEVFTDAGPTGLQSVFPWDPERFKTGNYIDAMALIRRRWLVENGGYVTDRRLHGWEDFDLWTRVAERGGHGVHLTQVVARYRSTRHSMLTLTDLSSTQAVSLLIERHPTVMAGVQPPL